MTRTSYQILFGVAIGAVAASIFFWLLSPSLRTKAAEADIPKYKGSVGEAWKKYFETKDSDEEKQILRDLRERYQRGERPSTKYLMDDGTVQYVPDPHWKIENQRGCPSDPGLPCPPSEFEHPAAPAIRVKVECWAYGEEFGGKLSNLAPGEQLYPDDCLKRQHEYAKHHVSQRERPTYLLPRERRRVHADQPAPDCRRGGCPYSEADAKPGEDE